MRFISQRDHVKPYRIVRLLTIAFSLILLVVLLIYTAAPGDLFYGIKRKTEGTLSLSGEELAITRISDYRAVGLAGNCAQVLLARDQLLLALQQTINDGSTLSSVYHQLVGGHLPLVKCITALPVAEVRLAVALIAGARGQQTGEMYLSEVSSRNNISQYRFASAGEQGDLDLQIFISTALVYRGGDFVDTLVAAVITDVATKSLVVPELHIPDELYNIMQVNCTLTPHIPTCDVAVLASEFAQMEVEQDDVLQLTHGEKLMQRYISDLRANAQ